MVKREDLSMICRTHTSIGNRKAKKLITQTLSLMLVSASLLCATNKGPDAGSYVATDATVYSFVDLATGGGSANVLGGTDDAVALLTLPFPFQFYGNTYSLICVSSNGLLSFVSSTAACSQSGDFVNIDLTSTATPGDLPSILPYWTDLSFQVSGSGAVYYGAQGAPGSRQFVVEWSNAYLSGSPNSVTFEVILSEHSNQVLFQYQSVDFGQGNPGSNASLSTIGIRDSGGNTNGRQIPWSYDAAVVGNSTAILFTSTILTATSISAPAVSYGASGTVTVMVTSSTNGSLTPTGNVSLTVDNGMPITAVLSNGAATFTIPGLNAGNHALTAFYAAQANFAASSANGTLTVNRAQTSTVLGSSLNPAMVGTAVTFTASVSAVASGASVPTGTTTFTDGSTVLAAVAVNGLGQATLITSSLAVGVHTITATYNGDANFFASQIATFSELIYAYPKGPGGGTFVVGDLNAAVGTQVTFWSGQWEKFNSLSGGAVSASFKGFADSTDAAPPSRHGTWTTAPGNSSKPPDSLPTYMGVIVSSSVTRSGPRIAGDIQYLVVVKTDAGYAPNPGHPGTGTVVAVIP